MATCGVLPNSSTSDELLAHSVRDGDDRAFELLYRRYWEPLCRYAGRLLRDVPSGEDAAQVAFANAYRALHAGQTPRAVRPWLYAIARNAAWGLRTERGDAIELPLALESRAESAADDTAALTAAVAQLPERQRAVFALRELRGATSRETADLLELRESQVEQLLFAGRARLAELLLFGDSVSCDVVRAAAATELGRHERRALKRHVHHCAECRALVGGRLKLGARLVEFLVGIAAPAKATIAATVAIAVSAPVVLPPAVHSVDTPRHAQKHPVAVPAVVHKLSAAEPPSAAHGLRDLSETSRTRLRDRPSPSATLAPPVARPQPAARAPHVAVTRTPQPIVVAAPIRERTTTTTRAVIVTPVRQPSARERAPASAPTRPSTTSPAATTSERVAPSPDRTEPAPSPAPVDSPAPVLDGARLQDRGQ